MAVIRTPKDFADDDIDERIRRYELIPDRPQLLQAVAEPGISSAHGQGMVTGALNSDLLNLARR